VRPPGGEFRLGIWPTPMPPLDGAPGVYVKREDLCGFAFGGSKVRVLEPLLSQAMRAGAGTIVVGGRRDSDWVALAAVAASRVGLGCCCILDPGASTTNSIRLARHFGATIRSASAPGAAAVNAAIDGVVSELGPSAFGTRRAGADATGVLGYRAMMREILAQVPPFVPADVVVALGSGGMTAGLLLGAQELAGDRDIVVHGVPVSKSVQQATDSVRALLTSTHGRTTGEVDVEQAMRRLMIVPRADACAAPGSLALLARRRSGVLLDPVFVEPAWSAFGAQPRDPDRTAVLVASGGLPAVFDSAGPGH